MRKLLIGVLIVLLIFITVYTVLKGISIGNIKILGFNNIKHESENIDGQISEITKIKEQEYKKSVSDMELAAKTLLQEKEKYASLITTSTDTEIQKATHGQRYDQEFLWAKIGNHATALGIKIKFDIKIGSINKENYDLDFTVYGDYTNVIEFIMALENDELLGFKIENFKMISVGGGKTVKSSNKATNTTTNNTSNNKNTTQESVSKETNVGPLMATFRVLDIGINIDKSKIQSTADEDTQNNASQNNTTNVTNTTNSIKNTETKKETTD